MEVWQSSLHIMHEPVIRTAGVRVCGWQESRGTGGMGLELERCSGMNLSRPPPLESCTLLPASPAPSAGPGGSEGHPGGFCLSGVQLGQVCAKISHPEHPSRSWTRSPGSWVVRGEEEGG